MTEPPDLPCILFVELVTDYLDGALTVEESARVEAHLDSCPGCTEVLAQWRTVVARSRELDEQDVEDLDATTRAALMDAFRQARRPV